MSLLPHLQCHPDQIAERVVLCGDPARVDRIASQLEQCEVLGQNREFRLINGSYQGLPITVCSTGIGGASAIIALEELVQAGARSLIRVGSAGALQHDIGLGDLIVVEGAVRNDGASQAYLPAEYPAWDALVERMWRAVCQGDTVVAHCRGGRGRSGTFAASVLMRFGWSADEAVALLRVARPSAVDGAQMSFLRSR